VCGALPPRDDPRQHIAVRLAVLLSEQVDELRPWLRRFAPIIGMAAAGVDEVLACPGCAALEDRVVVVVEPRDGTEYRVEAFRVCNPPGRRQLKWMSITPIPLPWGDPASLNSLELFEKLGALLRSAGLCPDTQVELCLPLELLSCRLDDIKFKVRKSEVTVARHYPLLVRCWDRHFDADYAVGPDYVARWKTAWKEFQAGRCPAPSRLAPAAFEGDTESVVIRLMAQCGQGLILSCCPDTPVGPETTVLELLIEAAVPVALMPARGGGSCVELADPASWPTAVKKAREDPAVSGITLLWDDPEGVPGSLINRARLMPP
jgi:hypothetical protein